MDMLISQQSKSILSATPVNLSGRIDIEWASSSPSTHRNDMRHVFLCVHIRVCIIRANGSRRRRRRRSSSWLHLIPGRRLNNRPSSLPLSLSLSFLALLGTAGRSNVSLTGAARPSSSLAGSFFCPSFFPGLLLSRVTSSPSTFSFFSTRPACRNRIETHFQMQAVHSLLFYCANDQQLLSFLFFWLSSEAIQIGA